MFAVEVRGWGGSTGPDFEIDDEKTFFKLAAERREGQILGRFDGPPTGPSGPRDHGTGRPPSCRCMNRGAELSMRGVACADPGRLPMNTLVFVEKGTSPGMRLVTVRGPAIRAGSGVAKRG